MPKGYNHTEETKRKMSEAAKGRVFTEEWRKKMSESLKGRVISKEHRKKTSDTMKRKGLGGKPGWNHTEKAKRTIGEKNRGKKRTEEELKKRTLRSLEYSGHWSHFTGSEIDSEGHLGFVYAIFSLDHGHYIGKKHYKFLSGNRQGQINGKWKSYTGSSDSMNAAIKEHGKENFKFLILGQYKTWNGLAHAEAWTQMILRTSVREDFHNRWIDKIRGKVKEDITLEHQNSVEKLKETLNGYMD